VDRNVREKLLEVAVRLFSSRGYAATSVREIVEGAGVSKPVLYYHFGSKEGIYLEILGWLQRTLEETLHGHVGATGSARLRLRNLCLDVFDRASKNLAAVRFLNAVFWGPPQGTPPFDVEAVHRPVQQAFRALAKEGAAAGEFGDTRPEDLAFALIGALSFAIDYQLAYPKSAPGRDGLIRVVDLILSGTSKSRREGASR
jgi:AcrR family transcriptional regulator